MDSDDDLAWFDGLAKRGVKLGLDNMRELLNRLGDPQEGKRFVHVAGTDGKGSVCAMIESILKASGMCVGAFTSPHIMKINECIRLDGEDISDIDFLQILSMVRPHVEDMADQGKQCTNFEVLTAVALKFFDTVSAEIAVIEVGMGGRLDSTNVIPSEVTVINSIGMEHTEFLGDTIEAIASEKAGIMKPGVPCVTINSDEVYSVLEAHAMEVGCPITRVDTSDLEVMDSKPDSIDLVYAGEVFTVALPGRHQARNAALAVMAVSMLPEYTDRISQNVSEGLRSVSWPCRMQKLIADPIIIDVTHTINGAECLRRDIEEIYGKVLLVLGMLRDKDIDGVSRELSHVADTVIATAPASPRAASPEEVAGAMSRYCDDVIVCPDVAGAIEMAMEVRDDLNVLVTGSFRMAEDVLTWLQDRSARF